MCWLRPSPLTHDLSFPLAVCVFHQALRYGRGRASGLGKTCGRGIKGQGQRKGLRKRGFEGGSTPFWRRMPKIGTNTHSRYYKMLTPLTVDKIVRFIKAVRYRNNKHSRST